MLKCIHQVLHNGHDQLEVVVEVHGIHFPMMGQTADSMKQQFSALTNQ
jgi:hypothetical protein